MIVLIRWMFSAAFSCDFVVYLMEVCVIIRRVDLHVDGNGANIYISCLFVMAIMSCCGLHPGNFRNAQIALLQNLIMEFF